MPQDIPEPFYEDKWLQVWQGDCRQILPLLPERSVNSVITSPPYYGLRDYGSGEDQIGLEKTPEEYVAALVATFRLIRRVLRDDGTVWLNLGDSYSSGARTSTVAQTLRRGQVTDNKRRSKSADLERLERITAIRPPPIPGTKPKDLLGIPWMVAFALRADGWYLRCDIVWSKPNPMPESVTDRPTKSHEYLFLLSKSPHYFYDAKAVQEPSEMRPQNRYTNGRGPKDIGYAAHRRPPGKTRKQDAGQQLKGDRMTGFNDRWRENPVDGRNLRSVWNIPTQPYPGAHFAVMPEALVEPCVKAGSPEGGVILDPFAGSGTVGLVAQRLSRRAILIDLSAEYMKQLMERNAAVPLGL